MSRKILTLLNGGRYVSGFDVSIILITECFQNNGHQYPTLRRITIDFLACQASSVPCERLFSGGGEIATKRRAQLGAARFEELQVMKFAWRNNIGDLAAWNSSQVEEIDDEMREYRDLLAEDGEQMVWDKNGDEIVSMD
jgi:hAT family C-terminal dimerisation region